MFRLFRRKASKPPQSDQKALVIHGSRLGTLGDIGEAATLSTPIYMNSAVAAVLRFAVRASSEPPWTIKTEKDKVTEGRPVLDLLANPNPWMDGVSFLAAIVTSLVLDCNAYILPVKDGRGEVQELYILMPDRLTPDVDPMKGHIRGYWYQGYASGQKYYSVEEIIHLNDGVNPAWPQFGWSGLKSVIREVLTDNEATSYTYTILKNLGVPGLILSLKDPEFSDMDDDAAEAIKAKVRATTTGANRGDVVVIDAPMDITNPGFKVSEMALDKVRLIPERRICAVVGVAPIVAGLGEDPKYDNYRAAREATYEQFLVPLWKTISRGMNQGLRVFLKPGETLLLDTQEVRALQEDADALHKRVRDDFVANIIDRATAKDRMGYESEAADKGKYSADIVNGPQEQRRASLQGIRDRAAQNRQDTNKT